MEFFRQKQNYSRWKDGNTERNVIERKNIWLTQIMNNVCTKDSDIILWDIIKKLKCMKTQKMGGSSKWS